MLFEGFFYNQNIDYNSEEIKIKYQECLEFDAGYIGINRTLRQRSIADSYFAGTSLKEKGIKSMSNVIAPSFIPSSFLDVLRHPEISSAGAIAWYSERDHRITLCRDLFGLVPLYYIQIPNHFIAFSTSLVCLAQNPYIKGLLTINEKRISAYATFLKDSSSSCFPETFYKEIKSVLPGHLVHLSLEGASTEAVYHFKPSRWSHLLTAPEFGEEFRSKFLKSIGNQLTNSGSIIASDLSGGLDSSSVSSTIKFLQPEIELHTLYNISSGSDTDENLLAASVAKTIRSYHHEIIQSEDDFGLLNLYTKLSGQPSSTFLSPSFNGSLMQYAKSLGAGAIFKGSGGDSIVGSGLELLHRAFDQQNWPLVKDLLQKRVKHFSRSEEYKGWANYTEDKKYQIVVQNFLFRRLAAKMIQLPFSDFARLFAELQKHFNVSYYYFLNRGVRSLFDRMKKGQLIPSTSILVDDLHGAANRHDAPAIELLEENSTPDVQRALLDVFSNQDLLSHEQNFVMSSHYGINYNSPFYNKDLFELCMAVPDVIKYGDGIGRAHFREAMRGILPEIVRTRSSKAHIRSHGQKIALRMYSQAEDFLMDSTEIWNYIDKQKFQEQVNILRNERVSYLHKINTWFHISRTISLSLWLEWFKDLKK